MSIKVIVGISIIAILGVIFAPRLVRKLIGKKKTTEEPSIQIENTPSVEVVQEQPACCAGISMG